MKSIEDIRFATTHEHRGGLSPDPRELWPSATLLKRCGGTDRVSSLIRDFYNRLELDAQINWAFPHFETNNIEHFFRVALGDGGGKGTRSLGPFHRGTIVTRQLGSRWLFHLKNALKESGIESTARHEILDWLKELVRRLVPEGESSEVDRSKLVASCSGVQTVAYHERLQLLKLAAKGQTSKVSEGLARDPAILAFRDAEGRSLLWQAVSRGRIPLVDLLLQHGADVNLPGCNPIIINLACSGNASIGTAVYVTPLTLALAANRDSVAATLVEHGAVMDMFSAAYLGYLPVLQRQISADHALLKAEDPAEDFKRITPLHHAVGAGQLEAANWLIEEGAPVEPHADWLLTAAALQDRPDLIELLLDHGANAGDAGCLGPLDHASTPVAELLVARGFDINSDSRFGPMLVRSCRSDVSSNEHQRVRTLLRLGADVNQDHHGMTALHYAVRGGQPDLISLLIESGADLERRDADGLTPLGHLAKSRAKADQLPVIKLLADAGADLNAQNSRGETILFHFSRRKDKRIVDWLLENGADPTLQNNVGRTAQRF